MNARAYARLLGLLGKLPSATCLEWAADRDDQVWLVDAQRLPADFLPGPQSRTTDCDVVPPGTCSGPVQAGRGARPAGSVLLAGEPTRREPRCARRGCGGCGLLGRGLPAHATTYARRARRTCLRLCLAGTPPPAGLAMLVLGRDGLRWKGVPEPPASAAHLSREGTSMDTDATFIAAMAAAYRLSQMLYKFAKLSIADLVSEGAARVGALARAAGADRGALSRVLPAWLELGLLERTDDGVARTPRGAAGAGFGSIRELHPQGPAASGLLRRPPAPSRGVRGDRRTNERHPGERPTPPPGRGSSRRALSG